MTKIILGLIVLCSLTPSAQTNTEVYLASIKQVYGGLAVFDFKNISNDAGYDNQPSFMNADFVVFAGNNDGQTDIIGYDIPSSEKTQLNPTTTGGEYSPQHLPNTNYIAAVRLDLDGTQRLYTYGMDRKPATQLIEELQVAYYTFYDDNTMVASVLSDDALDLVITDIKKKKTDTILTNIGRSIHKVPFSKSVSYTAINKDKNEDLYLLDMETRESFFICQLPIGIQDYTWLNDSQIIIGSGSKLFVYDTFLNEDWEEVADLSDLNIKNITRLAVSPDEKRIALVAEPN